MHVYLLAAGRGRRAGGPKAWRTHEGKPLLSHHLDFLARELTEATVVVSIQPGWTARVRALSREARSIEVDPDLTAFGALRALLAEAPLTAWSFVYHVDMPLWDADVFAALRARAAARPAATAVVPCHEGRTGHPVLLAPAAAPSLLALDPDTGRLDHWLRDQRVERVDVRSPSVLENWNA